MTDNTRIPKFTNKDVSILEKDVELYSGYFKVKRFKFQHPLFQGGLSGPVIREVVMRDAAVGVILVDIKLQKVVLIEQFRAGAAFSEESPWLLEVSSGLADPGESLEDALRREVLEETGCEILSLTTICSYFSSPGMSSEKMHLYCGLVDAQFADNQIHGVEAEGENIRVVCLSFEDAFDKLEQDKISNAATIISLQWLKSKISTNDLKALHNLKSESVIEVD